MKQFTKENQTRIREGDILLLRLLQDLFPYTFHVAEISSTAKVQVDSRLIREGDIFVALPGNMTDGHVFLSEAVAKGAKGLIIRDDFTGDIPRNIPFVRVSDTLATLQEIARRKIQLTSPNIIAVTGSVGKTTTKEFIRTFLESEYSVFSSYGNMNSQIGLSLSIINEALAYADWYVLEMGMTHCGDISTLVSIAPPNIALITSIHLVHSQNFNSLDEIARAKAEIFSSPKTALRLINKDSNSFHLLEHISDTPMRTYSISQKQSAYWTLERNNGLVSFYEGGTLGLQVQDPNFLADHIYDNLLAAVSAARSCSVSWNGIKNSFSSICLPPLRLETVIKKGVTFINDSYNASEPSMLAALEVLNKHSVDSGQRRIAVLGQMRELGNFSKECHERVGRKACDVADMLYCLGEEARPIYLISQMIGKPCLWTNSFEELVQVLLKETRSGDVMLLKGSKSNQLWRVLDYYSEELLLDKT